MPGDEAAVGVTICLAEPVAQRGLGAKVHVSEEELAGKTRGRLRCFAFVFVDDILSAPVE